MIIKKKIFDNKTTYIHVKNTEQNIFTITLNINIGSKYETKENSGVSHYVEHIFFNNTKKIKNVLEKLDKYGFLYNASTGLENTDFYIQCINKYWKEAVYIIYSMLYENLFDECNIVKEREIILQEYYNTRDDILSLLYENTYSKVFKDDNLSKSVIGTEHSIKNIGKKEILEYINKYYKSNLISIITCSNMNISKYQKFIELLFNNNVYSLQKTKFPKEIYNNKLEIIDNIYNKKIYRDKSYIIISYRTDGYSLYNQIALEFIDSMLTHGLYSKLYKVLRNKHNLIYGIGSFCDLYKYKGIFNIETNTDHTNIKELTKLLLLEINKIHKNGFTINDINSAKNKMILSYNLIKDNSIMISDIVIKNYINTNKLVSINQILKLINKISLQDINKHFRSIFVRKNLYISYSSNINI